MEHTFSGWQDCDQCIHFEEIWNWPVENILGEIIDGDCEFFLIGKPEEERRQFKLGDPKFCRFQKRESKI